MSGSVTPARRRYGDADSELEDFEPSVDGEQSVHSSGNKRRRLDSENEVEHEEDELGGGNDSGDEVCHGVRTGDVTWELSNVRRSITALFFQTAFDARQRHEAEL
jgi:hypothetical protein